MNVKFKYEKPLFVDLSVESAVGTTCSTGNDASYYCNSGSCPPLAQCYTGTKAQLCYTVGSSTCNPSSNSFCKACCKTGNTVASGITVCECNAGISAAWRCTNGGKASGGSGTCSTGGNYDYCY
jgi:hypothetical protein